MHLMHPFYRFKSVNKFTEGLTENSFDCIQLFTFIELFYRLTFHITNLPNFNYSISIFT